MKKTMNNNLKANFDNPKKEKSIFDESFFDDDEEDSEHKDEDDDEQELEDEEDEDEELEDLDENFDEELDSEELDNEEEYEEVEKEMDEIPNPGIHLNTALPNKLSPGSDNPNNQNNESIHDQRTSDKKRNLPKDIQFRLVCEVGQILIPFENLQELSIGSVVNFNNTLQNLYLSVNNVRVGEGMLVDIDGKIGIKVTHWYGRV